MYCGQPSPRRAAPAGGTDLQVGPDPERRGICGSTCLLWSDNRPILSQPLWKWLNPRIRAPWSMTCILYYVPDGRLYIFRNNGYDHHLPRDLEFDHDEHDSIHYGTLKRSRFMNFWAGKPAVRYPLIAAAANEHDSKVDIGCGVAMIAMLPYCV